MIGGSATYAGNAAGKFAINDPIGPADAGHFTADVELKAAFAANNAATPGGVTGMLDNFMANDEAVDWSVRLRRASWEDQTVAETMGAYRHDGDPDTTDIEASTSGTVWSIDGKEASSMSGTWSGQMYDESPGNAPAGDGSDVPTSTTGMFSSQFGSTHSMVGAFGATRE